MNQYANPATNLEEYAFALNTACLQLQNDLDDRAALRAVITFMQQHTGMAFILTNATSPARNARTAMLAVLDECVRYSNSKGPDYDSWNCDRTATNFVSPILDTT